MAQRTPIESGVPDNKPYMHPTMLKNYGNWRYHDRPRPGVLHHVSHTGDEVWSVRAGTQRQMDVYTIRKLCDIADTYAEGHVRFTIRSNIEFMVSDPAKVDPLIEAFQPLLLGLFLSIERAQRLSRACQRGLPFGHELCPPGIGSL